MRRPDSRPPYLIVFGVALATLGLVILLDQLVLAAVLFRSVALVLAVTFAVRYARRPWHRSAEGHHLMSFTVITAAFMAYATANSVAAYIDPTVVATDGPYPGRVSIAVVLYMLIAFELHQRNRLLTLADAEHRARRLQR